MKGSLVLILPALDVVTMIAALLVCWTQSVAGAASRTDLPLAKTFPCPENALSPSLLATPPPSLMNPFLALTIALETENAEMEVALAEMDGKVSTVEDQPGCPLQNKWLWVLEPLRSL